MDKQLARKLISAGVHFGHAASRWNPKMKPYILARRGIIHIIDVKQTLKGLLVAEKLIIDVVSSGRDVLFVGTKRQAQKAVRETAEKCKMHCVSERWLGGMLTNFRTIRSRLQRLEQLEVMEQAGTMEAESKKRAVALRREMRKIKSNLEGVRNMSRLPGAVVVVDAGKEYLALREAKKLEIPTVAIIDTNSDPETVDVPIPANDDSISAIKLILNELAGAVGVGSKMPRPVPAAQRPARVRSRRPTLARAVSENEAPEQPAEPQAEQLQQQPSLAVGQEPPAAGEPGAAGPVQSAGQ